MARDEAEDSGQGSLLAPALARVFDSALALQAFPPYTRGALQKAREASGFELQVGPYDMHWNVLANCVIPSEMLHSLQLFLASAVAQDRHRCLGIGRRGNESSSSARGAPSGHC